MTDQQTTETPETYAGLTREQVQALRREHGAERVKLLSAPVGNRRLQVVVRAPTRDEYDRYLETMIKLEKQPGRALAANRTLLLACLLAPDPKTVTPEFDARPALVDKFVEPVLNMAGADAEVREETF
ncbi:hypothetical protein [Deinococcus petrolearius]|uniref:Uncharacterized protein n=1 Tax=Deinococcus petrolearius TaxID=1751295 RepID=A0ABW1DFJ9_9DEIO